MSRGRSYITGPRSRPLLNARGEMAKHLANVARRFVADKANVGDVDAAIAEWRALSPAPSPAPRDGRYTADEFDALKGELEVTNATWAILNNELAAARAKVAALEKELNTMRWAHDEVLATMHSAEKVADYAQAERDAFKVSLDNALSACTSLADERDAETERLTACDEERREAEARAEVSATEVDILKAKLAAEKERLKEADENLPLHTGRHDNEAARVLGEVSRHGPDEGPSHGCVESTAAKSALASAYAERDHLSAKVATLIEQRDLAHSGADALKATCERYSLSRPEFEGVTFCHKAGARAAQAVLDERDALRDKCDALVEDEHMRAYESLCKLRARAHTDKVALLKEISKTEVKNRPSAETLAVIRKGLHHTQECLNDYHCRPGEPCTCGYKEAVATLEAGPAEKCDDCGAVAPLVSMGDNYGGLKTVCADRDACHRRSP